MKNSKYVIELTYYNDNQSRIMKIKTDNDSFKKSFIQSFLERHNFYSMKINKVKIILTLLVWNENLKQYELDDIYVM